MSKKKLNVKGITNELEGSSLFFTSLSDPIPLKGKSKTHDQIPIPIYSNRVSRKEAKKVSKISGVLASKLASLQAIKQDSKIARKLAITQSIKQNNKIARKLAGMEANRQKSYYVIQGGDDQREDAIKQPSEPNDFIETIRKAVKSVGKEALFVRLTAEEKYEIRTAVFKLNEFYRGRGCKTTENEVVRIAIKLLLEDHKQHGKQSILSITEEALNA